MFICTVLHSSRVLICFSDMLYYLAVCTFHSILQFPFIVPIREVHGHDVSKICQILHGSCFPPTGPVSDWISQGSLHLDRKSENITLSYAGSNDNSALLHPSFLPPIYLLVREKKIRSPHLIIAIDVFRFYLLVCSDSGRVSMSTADTSIYTITSP